MQDNYTSPLFPCSGSGEPRLGAYNRASILSLATTILGPLGLALICCGITYHYYTFLTLGINPALGYSGLSLLTIASVALVFSLVCGEKRRAYLEEELDHEGLKGYLDHIRIWAGDVAHNEDNSYRQESIANHIQRALN
ncbi:MAG: hypothetical protein S4CHLAM2_18160 [Chlamydiales bacterium]|nr:hypothetical protein [Chlamydiales bacterium]